MAKTNAALDREIKAVANIWNTQGSNDPYEHTNEISSAIFRTLRWARGCREEFPSVELLKKFSKKRIIAEGPNGGS